jgi:hypothetical protein
MSVVTYVKPTRSRRIGKPVESRRSSKAAACNKRCVMNAGDPMGKVVTVMRIRQRQLAPDIVGPGIDEPAFLAEISTGYYEPSTSVSITEEPGAGKSHAGIGAGGAG